MIEEPDVLFVYGDEEISSGARYFVRIQEKRGFALSSPHMRYLSLDASEGEIKQLLWEFLFLRFSYRILGNPDAPKKIEDFFAKVEHLRQGIHLTASDFRDRGKRVLANTLANFPELGRAKRSSDLFCRFKNRPAIICGASPSLEKEIETLRHWDDRGLIFAGGAALNVLSAFSVQPHLGAAIDPHPREARILHHEIPLFYQNRVSKELLAAATGPRLWVAGNGGYLLEEWMNEQMNLSSSFSGGWNVATFCTALAEALGCNPIIFVGLELSTPTQNVYAHGLDEKVGSEFVETVDLEGKKVFSKNDWVMAGHWLEEFAREHPRTQFLNATCGGLPLATIARITLEEALQKYGEVKWNVRKTLHASIEALPYIDGSQATTISNRVENSLHRCDELCHKLLSLFEARYPHLPGKSGEGSLYELELEEEIAYKIFLAPIWEIWKPLFLREEGDPYLHRLLFFKRIFEEKNLLEGPSTFYSREGVLLSHTLFDAGKPEGESRQYYLSGKLQSIQRFEKGIREGKQEYYYENGALKTLMFYEKGELHGEALLFFPDGGVKRRETFVHGKKCD